MYIYVNIFESLNPKLIGEAPVLRCQDRSSMRPCDFWKATEFFVGSKRLEISLLGKKA